jgi:hypothetical protein
MKEVETFRQYVFLSVCTLGSDGDLLSMARRRSFTPRQPAAVNTAAGIGIAVDHRSASPLTWWCV